MLKGHTKIILTDVNTGEQEVHEEDNLITNALNKIINMEIAMNHYPNDNLLPIATKALGGIMLFDGDLTESANNIHFPVEAHLVGYANTAQNTSDKYRGSWNSQESGKIENGYVSVWDFGTNQANGTIKSVARTHNHGGAAPLYNFLAPSYWETSAGNPTTDTYWYPIRYDGEYLYMLKGNSSTHLMRLARVRIPMLELGVEDYSDVGRQYEVIASWDTLLTEYTYWNNAQHTYEYTNYAYADDPRMYEDGGDGYIYCIGFGAVDHAYYSYNYDLTYFTIKYSDDSYDKSATVRKNVGVSKYTYNTNGFRWLRRQYGHVHNGTIYLLGGNRKVVHIIPLSNVASYRTIRLISDSISDYIESFEWVRPRNGGVYLRVYHYTTSSYNYLNGILYPDGVYIVPEVSYAGQSADHGNVRLYGCDLTLDNDLTVWGEGWQTSVIRLWTANYLGTINNLAAAITKTAAQTMKIVYTLTDVTE